MSETPPGTSISATVYAAGVPTLDATDFPNGGTPFKDSAGDWFVAQGGSVSPASLVSGVLEAGTGTPEFDLGWATGTHNARGTWDFSGATVTGLGAGMDGTFVGLTDTPADYGSAAVGDMPVINAAKTGLEFSTPYSSPLTEQGDILTRSADQEIRLAIGPVNSFLSSNGAQPKWGKASTTGGVQITGANFELEIMPAAATSTQASVESDAGGAFVAAATGSLAGAMVAADKSKLDGVEALADVTSTAILATLTTTGDLLVRSAGAMSRISSSDYGLPLVSTGAGAVPRYLALPSSGIASAAVTEDKIDADAVTTSKIEDEAVTASKIGLGAITATRIATDAVETLKLKDLNVTEAKLAAGSVTSTKIGALAVNGEDHIQTDSIIGSHIGAGEIGTSHLGSEVVTRAKIADSARADHLLPLWGRRSGTWDAGQKIRLLYDTTDNFNRLRVPAGKTFELLYASISMHNGSATGSDWSYRAGVREYNDDQSSSGGTYHYANATATWTSSVASDHVFFEAAWDGTTPLASITGGAAVTLMPFVENEASSPGTTTSENCHITLVGRIV